MPTLHNEMIADMEVMQNDLGNPSFVWLTDGGTYKCIANLSQFNRDLGDGGFRTQLLLTITVPRYDKDGTPIFPNDIIPQAQQKIRYNGDFYRIENVKQDSVFDYDSSGTSTSAGARIRIIATDTTKGL